MELAHNIIIEDRNKISITGVLSTTDFDETIVSLKTSKGNLIIKGENLFVEKLDLASNELTLTGLFYTLEYIDVKPNSSFFKKLFR